MSNSKLVNYTKISPNKTSLRTHKIDTITIHCVVGQCSVETLGNIFTPNSKQASSNYGIGYDGKIGMYVEEKDRSWCSSNAINDNRAVTIELASDTTHPYKVNDKAYKSLINLCVDICKRNGIKKLVWSTNKNSRVNHLNGCNMTVHRDYANKACPGEYLYSRHFEIAEEVNKRLGVKTESDRIYRVQLGAYSVKSSAEKQLKLAKDKGFKDAFIVEDSKKNSTKPVTKPQSPTTKLKPIDVIAREVIKGIWGNGDDRENRLKKAGYNYDAVQRKVNDMLR